jgi:hypothetical protein
VPPNPADAQPSGSAQPSGIALLLAGVLFVSGAATASLAGSTRPPSVATPSAAVSPSASASRSTVSATGRAGLTQISNAAAGGSESSARAEVVQPLLDVRTAAVLTGSRSGWLRPLLPSATVFRAEQATVFDRIRRLPVRGWSYRLIGSTPLTPARPALGRDAFVVQVVLAYRLPGDTRDVERRQYLTVARGSHGWALADDRDGPTEKALWDLAPLTVGAGGRNLVIGLGQGPALAARVHRTALEADAAARQVDSVWGRAWPRTVVVVIPQNLQQMSVVLGRTGAGGQTDGQAGGQTGTSGLDQVAAVTSGELDRCCEAVGGVADRVVVNPVAFGRLSALGRHVVLTHEFTHVATRASALVGPPLWVEEGFANYVGYRGSHLSTDVIASDLIPLVRHGKAEQQLPSAAAFDPAAGPIAAAYADSWLAVMLIARGSPARAVSFYRVAAGLAAGTRGVDAASRSASGASGASDDPDAVARRDLAAAFSTVLHTDQTTFETNWRTYRARLLGAAAR